MSLRIIQAIRIVKMFAWERSFVRRIAEARAAEMDVLRTLAALTAGTNL